MRLIIMRHSICKGINEKIINGWNDYELTKAGIDECEYVSKDMSGKLRETDINVVYTSFLLRTIDTAKIVLNILSSKVPVNKDIRLNERHYGVFQGKKREQVCNDPNYRSISVSAEGLDVKPPDISTEEYERLIDTYSEKTPYSKEELYNIIPHSESVLDVYKRVVEFLEQKIFIEENKDKTIFIVTHSNIIKMIAKYVEKLTFEQLVDLRFATCGIRIYDLDYNEGTYKITQQFNYNKEYNE